MPPAVTVPSGAVDQSPALAARIAVWTSLPRRGPATRALTDRRRITPKSLSCANSTSRRTTDRTLTSSAMIAEKGSSAAGSVVTTTNSASGSRARRLAPFRNDDTAEHTSRARSMPATSAWSAGSVAASGQSSRWTERPPVRPRQISSVVSGSNGATARVSTSNAV
ncbi:MAG: hypothetical protein BWY91_03149 [bacterium ADurb.BinA028]|nr:MAG: hypothetical protein BWY91_03149 [bacterium ADurb.BinA028]